MNASRRWLADLLGTNLETRDLVERLAMLGAPVDAAIEMHGELGGVLVGLVLEAGKHPNADRLSLCKVDAGGPEPFNVVCGAPNVQAGRKYPFAPVGTVLPGGLKLDRRKIRGETSEGMLCSARELGLGEDGAGILELNTDLAPGARFLDAMPIDDTRLVIDVSPNRGDLHSHVGLARDLGAVLKRPVKLTPFPKTEHRTPKTVRADGAEGTTAGVRITIEDTAGCPRYTAAVIRGVKVGPSPAWLEARIKAVGQRPINNVVDATNYLLFENGQPLHAFDLAKLAGPAIVVRQARAGETLTTLDGQQRKLEPGMVVIADGERGVALGGVMGGSNSEVSAGTTDILIECAYFDPKRTRATRRALGMSTEASYRYERGVDYDATAQCLARAVELMLAVCGGSLDGEPVDVFPNTAHLAPRTVFLRIPRVGQILGADVPRAEIERALTALGFVVGPRDDRLAVQVPSWRPDVVREIDVIEEIARVVGYDRFPDDMRAFRPGTVPDAPLERTSDRLRTVLTSLGLHEAMTLTLGPKLDERAPEVINPLSSEEAFLRTGMLAGLARRVEHNWRQMQRDVRIFEIGHIFEKQAGPLPREEVRVAGVVTGARRPPHWSDPAPPDADMYDAKGLLEAVLGIAQPGSEISVRGSRFSVLGKNGETLGWVEQLNADAPAWAAPVFGFELIIAEDAAKRAMRFAPLPTSPAAERDVALVLPEGVNAADIEATLRAAAGALLERLWVFDEYRGAPLAAGTRSVAWRLVFRQEGRTLRDAEVDAAVAKALTEVERKHDVRRREA